MLKKENFVNVDKFYKGHLTGKPALNTENDFDNSPLTGNPPLNTSNNFDEDSLTGKPAYSNNSKTNKKKVFRVILGIGIAICVGSIVVAYFILN